MKTRNCLVALAFVAASLLARDACAGQEHEVSPASAAEGTAAETGVNTPADFVIGPDDVLSILFWRDKEMSTQVTVRPDGRISLPLLNEVQAAGLTPANLRTILVAESKRFIANPNVTVVVHQINSRKVFITGQVVKPGPYALTASTTVLQLISMAGGLKDFADRKNIMIVRHEKSRTFNFHFNYNEIGRNPHQDIELKPGDTVVVP